MAIQKLPEEVRSAVRSGIAISSTAQCVAELVMNSLDANATVIIIHLDIPHFKLEVDDNGNGITFQDLHHVGIRYHTSKCRSMQDLQKKLHYNGYRGEALASLSEFCGFLVLVTRPKHDESDKTYLKTFTRGKPHKPIETSCRRKSHGTTVTVQDYMCSAPVRQKRIIPNVDIEEIRIQVEGIALSHPHVSFTIIDDSDNSIVRRIQSSSSTLETFSQLYGLEISKNLNPIGPFTSGKLTISGFISTSSYHNKSLQFIFVNGRLVRGTKIHKLINMIMRKSDVLRGNGPWQELPMPERMRDFLWVSPLKKKDRYCVFMVNIICPVSEYDITLDPKKTLIEFCDWDTLIECMENVVKSFLKEHNLACIAPDQEPKSSQNSDGSSSSLINEMEQLEKEDALGQRLSHFRCPIEMNGDNGKTVTSGKNVLNMRTAIHSIPAKRNLVNAFVPSKLKGKCPSKEEAMEKVCSNDGHENTNSKVESVKVKDNVSKPSEVSKIDQVNLIKFPLLQEDNDTPINVLDKLQNSSHQLNIKSLVEDSVNGSLGRFRKTFQKTQYNSLKTPDDIKKIIVEAPPPIVRRKVPLEHHIKGFTKKLNPGVSTITVYNKPTNKETGKKETILPNQLKKFEFNKHIINNTGKSISLSQKNISSCDKITNLINNSNCSTVLSAATQTEGNQIRDSDLKCAENIQNNYERLLKPNLKKLNVIRRQFHEVSGYHSRIKVYKCDDVNKDHENEINIGDKANGAESCSDYCQFENSDLSKLQDVAPGFMCQKQTQVKSDFLCTTEKTGAELEPEIKSTHKLNFNKLISRKKYFEETMGYDCLAGRSKCDDLGKDARQGISTDKVHYGSHPNLINVLSSISAPEARNELEKQHVEIPFLTSEDFIVSLDKGEDLRGSDVGNLVSGNIKDTIDGVPVPPQFEDKCQNSVPVDDKCVSGNMPVLEPYYCANINSTSEQFSIDNSPPSLLNDKYYPHQPDTNLWVELLANWKQPEPLLLEKIGESLNSCAIEKNSAKYGSSSEKDNDSYEDEFKNLEGYKSQNLNLTKPDSSLINRYTSDRDEACNGKNSTKIHSLVPMYNSDSEDDTTNEMHDIEKELQSSGSLSTSKNVYKDNFLVNSETHIIKRNFSSQNVFCDKGDFMDSAFESALRVCNDQVSLDHSNTTEKCKNTPGDNGNCLECEKMDFVQSDISNSPVLSSHFSLDDQPLENLLPQNNGRIMTFTNDAENVISPQFSKVEHSGGKEKSPFFGNISECNDALSEKCHKLENSDRIENLELQSESVTDSNSDDNVPNKDVGFQKETRFEMFARPAFCPKGLSPVMPVNFPQHKVDGIQLCHVLSSEEESNLDSIIKSSSVSSDELSWIKWSRCNENRSPKKFLCGTATTLGKSDKHTLVSLFEKQDQNLISEMEILSACIENQSKSFVRVFNLIHPCTFSKEVLSNLKMIGKLDCKFIVAKVKLQNDKFSDVIVLFDQHAVHERIRLERLTQEYQIRDKVNSGNDKGHIKYISAPAVPTFDIVLNTSEARLLESFQEHFERLGLVFDVLSRNENGSGNVIIEIKEVPACLLSKELKESGSLGLKDQVHSLIREQVEHLLVTRGIGVFSPNVLRNAINMKACRGAVKFGDSLSDQECHWLLRKLSVCDTPFQCAHGRPSMYPIIEVDQLKRFYSKSEEDCKPRLWRLKQMMEQAFSRQKQMENNE